MKNIRRQPSSGAGRAVPKRARRDHGWRGHVESDRCENSCYHHVVEPSNTPVAQRRLGLWPNAETRLVAATDEGEPLNRHDT
jgi:hypothetical protein